MNHAVIAVLKGSGKLAAKLSRVGVLDRLSKLPERIELTVSVTDPDGRPLEGARVTFTLAVAGRPRGDLEALETGGDGAASWTTTIPKGATAGQVSATVIVKTTRYGDTTDRTVINISSSSAGSAARRRCAARRGHRDYHSRHGPVAVPALRHAPARRGTVLGLQALLHQLRHVPPLPGIGRGPDRLLRARPRRRRSRGDEIRGCWVAVPAIADGDRAPTARRPPRSSSLRRADPGLRAGRRASRRSTRPASRRRRRRRRTAPADARARPAPADDGMLWSDLEA